MKWIKVIIIDLAIFGIVSAVIFTLGNMIFKLESGPGGPDLQAQANALAIAEITNMYVEDHGTPPEPHSLANALCDPDKSGRVYANRKELNVNADGQICDPSGHPFVFTITAHSITVTSLYYPSVRVTKNF